MKTRKNMYHGQQALKIQYKATIKKQILEKVPIHFQMDLFIKVNGKMLKCTVKEIYCLATVIKTINNILFNLTLILGNSYVGEFHHNNLEGNGKLTYPNGDIYEGAFKCILL